ncbi:Riboflavin synthase eukaryotic [Labilithrix luteola]|uniref:Riboflavin synthase n=1 Tax=Labilithrix luteola TaxID=1391654 RepID=A0A0K1Q2R9_9BACT|nr:riboflavin synthase [Labilithrix luteola]AKV00028.1 Riboflavin synthase eukaryotic [Labilithrix luteola]
MFTGLVESKGKLVRRSGGTGNTRDARLVVEGDFGLTATPTIGHEPLVLGESIAVDGVCLTVASIVTPGGPGTPSVFEADASAETLAKTTLGELSTGATVNLERAVPLGGRMGGHIVSGHVDGVGRIAAKAPDGAAVKVTFQPPPELMRYIAPKGSICVNGVSLTVNGVSSDGFDVMIIPHTREKTSLDVLSVGAKVNLEVDLLARYVARILQTTGQAGGGNDHAASDAAWLDRLKRSGYM